MNKSTPDLPLHRARLRRALLASPQFEGSSIFMKKLLPIGLALILLLTLNTVQDSNSTLEITPQVSAQELIEDTIQNLQNLSEDELQAIEDRLEWGDAFSPLRSAQMAHDLSYVEFQSLSCADVEVYSEEPMQSENAFDVMMVSDVDFTNPDCKALLFIHELAQDSSTMPLDRDFRLVNVFDQSVDSFDQLTYVQFQSPDGAINILGIDSNLTPIVSFGFGDGALSPGASLTITSGETENSYEE